MIKKRHIKREKVFMAYFYKMDFMKGTVNILLEFAFDCPYVYCVPPLVRDRLHFLRDTDTKKEFDIPM